jgi:hypothetical protein
MMTPLTTKGAKDTKEKTLYWTDFSLVSLMSSVVDRSVE